MTFSDACRSVVLVLEVHVKRCTYAYGATLLVLMIVASVLWFVLGVPPNNFPAGQPVSIASGTSVSHEAAVLREAGFIRSTILFRILFRLMPGTHGVQSGTYVFSAPTGELSVAWNLAHGIAGVPTLRVTFPEGTTVRHMGSVLGNLLPHFDEQKFDSLGLPEEGYLFPDTYFFVPGMTEQEVINRMHDEYLAQTKNLQGQFASFGKSEREIVTMASLLEGEGKTLADRRMIAGILWHRIALGMPLQVDATFGYEYGKTGYVPTEADLKSNSAYNSYRYTGLPPTPINNPGLASIEAAITPTSSNYLYYLTGDDGVMHYATTYAEHLANQKKYFK